MGNGGGGLPLQLTQREWCPLEALACSYTKYLDVKDQYDVNSLVRGNKYVETKF